MGKARKAVIVSRIRYFLRKPAYPVPLVRMIVSGQEGGEEYSAPLAAESRQLMVIWRFNPACRLSSNARRPGSINLP